MAQIQWNGPKWSRLLNGPKWSKWPTFQNGQIFKTSECTKLLKYLNNCQISQPMCSKFENGKVVNIGLNCQISQHGPNLKWTKMVKNEPNFKTLELTKFTKVLKISIIVKLPQSDQNLKMG